MHIAILTFDGFNELDSLIPFGILNRVTKREWRVSIASRALLPAFLCLADFSKDCRKLFCIDRLHQVMIKSRGQRKLSINFLTISGNGN